MKYVVVLLQEEQFLQSLAELTGQTRKPKIPKEGTGNDLKLKLKLRPGVRGWGENGGSGVGGAAGTVLRR